MAASLRNISVLRHATPDDFRRYFPGREPPEVWWGVVAEQGEDILAIGTVTWRWHRVGVAQLIAWCSFDANRALSAVVMHRTAKRTLARLGELGESIAYCACNYEIPGAEKWLRKLGFVPDPKMTADYGSLVWSVRLADG